MRLNRYASSPLLRYSLVGVANTATDFMLFAGLVYGLQVPAVPANVMAFMAAVTQSWLLNSCWTFSSRNTRFTWRRYGLFVCVNLGGLAISTLTIVVLQPLVPVLLAKMLAVSLVLAWGFLLSRRFVFTAPVSVPRWP